MLTLSSTIYICVYVLGLGTDNRKPAKETLINKQDNVPIHMEQAVSMIHLTEVFSSSVLMWSYLMILL